MSSFSSLRFSTLLCYHFNVLYDIIVPGKTSVNAKNTSVIFLANYPRIDIFSLSILYKAPMVFGQHPSVCREGGEVA